MISRLTEFEWFHKIDSTDDLVTPEIDDLLLSAQQTFQSIETRDRVVDGQLPVGDLDQLKFTGFELASKLIEHTCPIGECLLVKEQHISVAAWARAQILLASERAAEKSEITADLEARQREQEETLAETKALLKETVRLYQSAAPSRTKKG